MNFNNFATVDISESDILSKLLEADNELPVQSEKQSGDTQRDDGGSVIVRGTDTFQEEVTSIEGIRGLYKG